MGMLIHWALSHFVLWAVLTAVFFILFLLFSGFAVGSDDPVAPTTTDRRIARTLLALFGTSLGLTAAAAAYRILIVSSVVIHAITYQQPALILHLLGL